MAAKGMISDQHDHNLRPYVDVFHYLGAERAGGGGTERNGDVTAALDRDIKRTAWRVWG